MKVFELLEADHILGKGRGEFKGMMFKLFNNGTVEAIYPDGTTEKFPNQTTAEAGARKKLKAFGNPKAKGMDDFRASREMPGGRKEPTLDIDADGKTGKEPGKGPNIKSDFDAGAPGQTKVPAGTPTSDQLTKRQLKRLAQDGKVKVNGKWFSAQEIFDADNNRWLQSGGKLEKPNPKKFPGLHRSSGGGGIPRRNPVAYGKDFVKRWARKWASRMPAGAGAFFQLVFTASELEEHLDRLKYTFADEIEKQYNTGKKIKINQKMLAEYKNVVESIVEMGIKGIAGGTIALGSTGAVLAATGAGTLVSNPVGWITAAILAIGIGFYGPDAAYWLYKKLPEGYDKYFERELAKAMTVQDAVELAQTTDQLQKIPALIPLLGDLFGDDPISLFGEGVVFEGAGGDAEAKKVALAMMDIIRNNPKLLAGYKKGMKQIKKQQKDNLDQTET